MITTADERTCPYCGGSLVLGDLPIVATRVTRGATGTSHGPVDIDDSDGPPAGEEPRPVSGAEHYGTVGEWPVIAEAPCKRYPQVSTRRLSRAKVYPPLPDVRAEGHRADMPARICTRCKWPLPVDIDTRPLLTVGVAGLKGASKTNFMIAALHQACKEQQRLLGPALCCAEFTPDESTNRRLCEDYKWDQWDDDTRTVLSRTEPALMAKVRFEPLVFRASFSGHQPVALLFHDIAGEVFAYPEQRAMYTPFLARAAAMIFIIDPARLPPIKQYVQQRYNTDPPETKIDQPGLVNALAEDMFDQDISRLPVAMALSRSDLLTSAWDHHFVFAQDPPADPAAWSTNREAVDQEVRSLLAQRLAAADLVAAASRFSNVTYHAVAPLGVQPEKTERTVSGARTLRCLDPLVSVLGRLFPPPG